MSVCDAEGLVRREASPRAEPAPKKVDPNARAAEEQLRVASAQSPHRPPRKGGRIEVDFKDEDELQRVFELLTED